MPATALSLPEKALLLLTKPDGRWATLATSGRYAVAGAVLCDLVAAGGASYERKRVEVVPGFEAEPGPLAEAHRALARKSVRRSTLSAVELLVRAQVAEHVADALARRGILGRERHRTLGLFTEERHPELDGASEEALRAALRRTIDTGEAADPDAALLLDMLDATGQLRAQFGRVTKERRREIAERSPAAEAVRDAQSQALAAAMVPMLAGAVTALAVRAG